MKLTEAAKLMGVSKQALSAVMAGKVAISPEMAVRLELAFRIPAQSLLHLQLDYDLYLARQAIPSINSAGSAEMESLDLFNDYHATITPLGV